ncbi:MAG: hypothetical protein IPO87_12645 [Flavobacteriales bacterium]|nr:hypothetical protein [Flavobacteriales bacterium]
MDNGLFSVRLRPFLSVPIESRMIRATNAATSRTNMHSHPVERGTKSNTHAFIPTPIHIPRPASVYGPSALSHNPLHPHRTRAQTTTGTRSSAHRWMATIWETPPYGSVSPAA